MSRAACTVIPVLEIDVLPELRDPVLVVALTGWVDAGQAGSTVADELRARLGAVRVFAWLDLADLVDLQQTRPDVEIVEGLTKRVTWPEIECVAGRRARTSWSSPAPSRRCCGRR